MAEPDITARIPRSNDPDDVFEVYGEKVDRETVEWIDSFQGRPPVADIEPTADPLEHYEYMPCSHALSSQGWICRECAKRWARNQLQAAEREVAALRGEVGRLRAAIEPIIREGVVLDDVGPEGAVGGIHPEDFKRLKEVCRP